MESSGIVSRFNSVALFYTSIAALFGFLLLGRIYMKCRRDPRLVKFSKSLPGPPDYPVVGHSMILFRNEDTLKLLVDYAEKYGHTYRLWIGNHLAVVLSKVEDIEKVFRSSKMLGKPPFFKTYKDFWGEGLFTINSVSKWRSHRKAFLPVFNHNVLNTYVPQFNEKIHKLSAKLENFVNGPEFDIGPHLNILSFDVTAKVVMDVDLDWEDDFMNRFRSIIIKAGTIAFAAACLPWFQYKFFDVSFKMYTRTLRETAKEYIRKIVAEKRDEMKRRMELYKTKNIHSNDTDIPPKPFLTCTYELQEAEEDEEVLYDEILNTLTGGIDTAAITNSFFLLAVAIHQDIQNKLFDEINEYFGDTDRLADAEDIKHLSYLDQVLKETLRRFTINAVVCRYVEEDCKIGDEVFPAGTSIIISLAGVHFDPEHYSNPWKFNPDNFTPEAIQKRHKLAFLPFSAGQRNCIAQHFSILEMKMTLVALLRKYSFHTTMKMEDIHLMNNGFALISVDGYKITIKPRQIPKNGFVVSSSPGPDGL